MSTDRRVAVITGGAQGIGRRTAEVLAERGYNLALIDLREPVATMAAAEQKGAEVYGRSGDITSEATVSEFAQRVFDRFGRVDVLVNNAGISHIAPAEATSFAEYRRVLEVNLAAPFLLCQVFGKRRWKPHRAPSSTLRRLPDCSRWPIGPPTTRQSMG